MEHPFAIWTTLLIVITCLFTFKGFHDRDFERKHIFCPEDILAGKQFFRLLTSGFLHADWKHLLFNMLSLYLFAEGLEFIFGWKLVLLVYFGSLLGGSLLSLWIHRHHDYRAYGASGAVSGIIFAHIFLLPGGTIGSFFIPVGIPAWLYAGLFMLASFIAMTRGNDNIGHDAHLGGAMTGFAIAAAAFPEMISHQVILFYSIATASVVLLAYLLLNPLWLPLKNFEMSRPRWRGKNTEKAPEKKKFNVDLLLEKISQKGMDSLTAEERHFLESVSEKYRRRAESKKPESGLLF